MSNSSRIGSIDFWRGGVLIAILVDHIPGNVLESLTPRNFGLSDSAEAFVFLSGLSVGLVYLPRARRQGFESVARSDRLAGEDNRGLRLLLYLFERDEAARLMEAG